MARGVGGLGEDELRPVISTPDQRHSKRPHAACHSADGTRCAKVTISLGWRFACGWFGTPMVASSTPHHRCYNHPSIWAGPRMVIATMHATDAHLVVHKQRAPRGNHGSDDD
jgi:hypothetical protein